MKGQEGFYQKAGAMRHTAVMATSSGAQPLQAVFVGFEMLTLMLFRINVFQKESTARFLASEIAMT